MNPQFPVYIISKGRWDTRLTSRALEGMGVPYSIVVEEQEHESYADVIDKRKILVLDKAYQRDYDAFDTLGSTISKGSGPARNFVWDHSMMRGASHHWLMDDNIAGFYRLHDNLKVMVGDGTALKIMEDFTLRYSNVALSGPNYLMFVYRKKREVPLVINSRIYSCILIRNDIGFRWRCRYNEDTDLSLRVLKAGWCTVQFNTFLQWKMATLSMKGGNTEGLYASGRRNIDKSRMVVAAHPDVASLVRKWGRWHHYVDYGRFKESNKLMLREGVKISREPNDYGMRLTVQEGARRRLLGGRARTPERAPRSPGRSTSASAPMDGG